MCLIEGEYEWPKRYVILTKSLCDAHPMSQRLAALWRSGSSRDLSVDGEGADVLLIQHRPRPSRRGPAVTGWPHRICSGLTTPRANAASPGRFFSSARGDFPSSSARAAPVPFASLPPWRPPPSLRTFSATCTCPHGLPRADVHGARSPSSRSSSAPTSSTESIRPRSPSSPSITCPSIPPTATVAVVRAQQRRVSRSSPLADVQWRTCS